MKVCNFTVVIAVLSFLISCDKNEQLPISVGKVERSECKSGLKSVISEPTPDTLCCVNYSYYPSEKQLIINHINAGFNCCPGEISCLVKLNGDTLIIEESESAPQCDCDCLFDLNYKIDNVVNTISQIIITEPYCNDNERIEFKVSLKENKDGCWCTTRKSYPWGM
jgi:hypothetical protein